MIDLKTISNLPTTGFLFVGDPHIWSHKPGRRKDNYLESICSKLKQIALISNEKNLWPVILGDLFHQAQDNNLYMLSEVTRIFNMFLRKPIVLVGNHDLTENKLTPGTALELFHSSGQILTVLDNAPFAFIDLVDEKDLSKTTERVILGGTPYGEDIPISLAPWFKGTTHDAIKKKAKCDTIIWITHDDLSFDSNYPNAKQLKPILGCDLAVNGHMHRTQKPLRVGNTSWHNPGNISRISVDLIRQDVAVWVWKPALEEETGANDLPVIPLVKICLDVPDGASIISLEGRIASEHQDTLDKKDSGRSRFVEQLRKDQQVVRTDEAHFLRESLDREFEEKSTPEHVVRIVNNLFSQAVSQHQSKEL